MVSSVVCNVQVYYFDRIFLCLVFWGFCAQGKLATHKVCIMIFPCLVDIQYGYSLYRYYCTYVSRISFMIENRH